MTDVTAWGWATTAGLEGFIPCVLQWGVAGLQGSLCRVCCYCWRRWHTSTWRACLHCGASQGTRGLTGWETPSHAGTIVGAAHRVPAAGPATKGEGLQSSTNAKRRRPHTQYPCTTPSVLDLSLAISTCFHTTCSIKVFNTSSRAKDRRLDLLIWENYYKTDATLSLWTAADSLWWWSVACLYETVSHVMSNTFMCVSGLPAVVAHWTRWPQPLWWAACSCVRSVHWLCVADDQTGTCVHRLTGRDVHGSVQQLLQMCGSYLSLIEPD